MGRIIESSEQSAARMKMNVCHRSSAIFFAQVGKMVDTRLTFLNHFLLKRDIPEVKCVVTFRALDGTQISQTNFNVTEPRTYSVTVRDFVGSEFVGSAEIEFLSEYNLGVPFCATMAIYKSQNGYCQLHAYSRTYNTEEITEDRVYQKAAEIGWTLRDTEDVQSLAILHNGPESANGKINIRITNSAGERVDLVLPIATIPAYGSLQIVPSEHYDVKSFLAGQPGHGAVFFPASRAFPRMCCGNRRVNADGDVLDLQLTHSNFNYSVHQTPRLNVGEKAFSFLPHLPQGELSLVVYPHYAQTEEVVAEAGGRRHMLRNDQIGMLPAQMGGSFVFETSDRRGLPNRLVNGLIADWKSKALPAECSYGVVTSGYKAATKHWYWGYAGEGAIEAYLSGFFASDLLSVDQFKDTVEIVLYDQQGECGRTELSMDDFRKGPIALTDVRARETKGVIYYRAAMDYTMGSFFSVVFDPKKKSGSIEHSF